GTAVRRVRGAEDAGATEPAGVPARLSRLALSRRVRVWFCHLALSQRVRVWLCNLAWSRRVPVSLSSRIWLCLMASSWIGGLGCAGSDGDGAAGPPDIILISIDTLRPDHLGAYGYGRDTSPVLDSLAARGATFANAFAQSS